MALGGTLESGLVASLVAMRKRHYMIATSHGMNRLVGARHQGHRTTTPGRFDGLSGLYDHAELAKLLK